MQGEGARDPVSKQQRAMYSTEHLPPHDGWVFTSSPRGLFILGSTYAGGVKEREKKNVPNKPEEKIDHRLRKRLRDAPVGVSAGKHAAEADIDHEQDNVADTADKTDQDGQSGPRLTKTGNREYIETHVEEEQARYGSGFGAIIVGATDQRSRGLTWWNLG